MIAIVAVTVAVAVALEVAVTIVIAVAVAVTGAELSTKEFQLVSFRFTHFIYLFYPSMIFFCNLT